MSDPAAPQPPARRNEPTLLALRQRREHTISLLCEHFARDHLETNELVELIDRAHAATSIQELDALLKDLPTLAAPEPVEAPERTSPPVVHRREHQPIVAIMGGVERKGRWTPGKQVYAVAFMGGIGLDFRDANLPPGYTDVFALAWMGGIEIFVPPGLQVVSEGIGIMGGFEHGANEHERLDPARPILRIRGAAVMGAVEISAREKGQPGRWIRPHPPGAPRLPPERHQRGRRSERREDRWLDEP